ncbi:MAG: hypothetical protein ISR64_10995 [Deltaproteobacteria bacterium]|nr:hypothetical protein [Deltaproteobacteria bacterium]
MNSRFGSVLGAFLVVAWNLTACSSGGGDPDVMDPGTGKDIPVTDEEVPSDPGTDGVSMGDGADGIDDPGGDTGKDVTGDEGTTHPGFKAVDLADVGTVRSMWASQEAGIWAVGDGGLILRYNGLDFVPVTLAPSDVDLFGVGGEGATVVVVGAAGTVLRYDGTEWTALQPPVDSDLHGVGVLGAEDFYVVGKGGVILRYKDGQWNQEGVGVSHDLYGAYASKVGGVYAVGAYGTLVELKGTVWIQSQIGGPASTLRSIWRAPDGRMFAVGTLGTVTVFDGVSWKIQVTNDTYVPARDLYGVQGFSGEEVYAVGDQGAILKYNGKKWTLMTIAGPYNVFSDFRGVAGLLNPDGSRTLFAAGTESHAVRLEDKAWADQQLGVTGDLSGAWVRGDGTLVAVGSHGLVVTYAAGRSGTLDSGVTADLHAVDGGYVAGTGGTLLRLTADEVEPIESGTQEDLNDVWAVDGEALVVGDAGTYLMVQGTEALQVSGLPGFSVKAVVQPWAGTVVVAGEAGKMYADQGEGFKSVFTGTFSTMWDLWAGTGEDVFYAVGDNGVVLSCDLNQCQRVYEEPATFLYGMGGSRDSAVLAVGWAGTVLDLTTGGEVADLDAGTFRVFRAVAGGGPDNSLFLVGANGTFFVYTP